MARSHHEDQSQAYWTWGDLDGVVGDFRFPMLLWLLGLFFFAAHPDLRLSTKGILFGGVR